ncbi:hypothetical protein Vretifemale_10122 [Volvox reticuliferus]|uniref:Uncharacterized protein n=1 Tax=Volvox reticuliferus TaxID=1737510 RepID=A0A8J4FNG5_9CHLO|nr:hypothetical protein Vretifemale_10122 [Volvox reticuliferus]
MTFKGYKLNIWDIGGQKTLRPYWRNYYEKTDALIWVVDSADLARLNDCREELHNLLKEERLFGASLLIFANKQDIPSALSVAELEKVATWVQRAQGAKCLTPSAGLPALLGYVGLPIAPSSVLSNCSAIGQYTDPDHRTTSCLHMLPKGHNAPSNSQSCVISCPACLLTHCNVRLKVLVPLTFNVPQALDIASISKRHCRIVACSAVDGTGLLEGFEFVVNDISSRIYLFS